MADETTGSPYLIAYRLLFGIAAQENKTAGASVIADKEWILNNYAECLNTVQNPGARVSGKHRRGP